MICSVCGKERVLTPCERKRLENNKKFICDSCRNYHFWLETELPVTFRDLTFTLEEELRLTMLNAFVRRGLEVYDCLGQSSYCRNPIVINGIPMRPFVGDIPFVINYDLWMIELKLDVLKCVKSNGKDKHYLTGRSGIRITEFQWQLILRGRGILVVVLEQVLTDVGHPTITERTKKGCEKALTNTYRKLIQNGEIPYNVWIIDPVMFKTLWDSGLEDSHVTKTRRYGKEIKTKYISRKLAQRVIPEAILPLTFPEIVNGEIVDLILEII